MTKAKKGRPAASEGYVEHLPTYAAVDRVERGAAYVGVLHVSRVFYERAYVKVEGFGRDVLIDGLHDRNRAFDEDVVAIELRSPNKASKQPDAQSRPRPGHGEATPQNPGFIDKYLNERGKSCAGSDGAHREANVCHDGGNRAANNEFHVSDDIEDDEDCIIDENALEAESEDERKDRKKAFAAPADDAESDEERPLHGQATAEEFSARVSDNEASLDAQHGENDARQRPNRQLGYVVAILEPSKSRSSLGSLVFYDWGRFQFRSMDPCAPRAIVDKADLGKAFQTRTVKNRRVNICDHIVSVEYTDWFCQDDFPHARVLKSLGKHGDVQGETNAILKKHLVNSESFSKEALDSLPASAWKLGPEHLEGRRDFREWRVFSIDPDTARDLDDALSVQRLEDGSYEVGVHIADVATFVSPGTVLDKEAADRATSVYLVNLVVPMLPRRLCEQLCSLNGGVERLAFSVVWRMNEYAEVVSSWFGRSVISSCARLTYKQAQTMIDAERIDSVELADVPVHGDHTMEDVVADVRILALLARQMRKRRYEGGALKLGRGELRFKIDVKERLPTSFDGYEQRESNHLVEEFMLLANMSVANFISNAFPNSAVLRRHGAPSSDRIEELSAILKSVTGEDISTNDTVEHVMTLLRQRYEGVTMSAIEMLATKSMQTARYFKCGSFPGNEWRHYALNVPRYTHFTSPIRRYVDVLVHRLLQRAIELYGNEGLVTAPFQSPIDDENGEYRPGESATEARANSTGQCDDPQAMASLLGIQDDSSLDSVVAHCNEKNYNAKCCSRDSSLLFARLLLYKSMQILPGVVLNVTRTTVEVYVPKLDLNFALRTSDIASAAGSCAWNKKDKSVSITVTPQSCRKSAMNATDRTATLPHSSPAINSAGGEEAAAAIGEEVAIPSSSAKVEVVPLLGEGKAARAPPEDDIVQTIPSGSKSVVIDAISNAIADLAINAPEHYPVHFSTSLVDDASGKCFNVSVKIRPEAPIVDAPTSPMEAVPQDTPAEMTALNSATTKISTKDEKVDTKSDQKARKGLVQVQASAQPKSLLTQAQRKARRAFFISRARTKKLEEEAAARKIAATAARAGTAAPLSKEQSEKLNKGANAARAVTPTPTSKKSKKLKGGAKGGVLHPEAAKLALSIEPFDSEVRETQQWLDSYGDAAGQETKCTSSMGATPINASSDLASCDRINLSSAAALLEEHIKRDKKFGADAQQKRKLATSGKPRNEAEVGLKTSDRVQMLTSVNAPTRSRKNISVVVLDDEGTPALQYNGNEPLRMDLRAFTEIRLLLHVKTLGPQSQICAALVIRQSE